MAPRVTKWGELDVLTERFDDENGQFQYTKFSVIDDDGAHFGQLNRPKLEISLPQVVSALRHVPDEDIFPEWPLSDAPLTRAPREIPVQVYVKRPCLELYDVFKKHHVLHLLPQGLMEEARALQVLHEHPHPNIVRFHGCQVQRGRITGLVLDRHSSTLSEYLIDATKKIDNGPFMEALESAIHHLHSLGWAHNDLNPGNIMVDEAGMPVLIDFGSSHLLGAMLGTSRGNQGWIDEDMRDYTTSQKCHDISALSKIRKWLEKPTFELGLAIFTPE